MRRRESFNLFLSEDAFSATIVVPQSMDTDQFETFSGEIERQSDLKKVLVEKAREGMRQTGLQFGLASEGSFGPHPS